METEDPLADLADIHLPGAVDFWPPAPGWWVLAALFLLALLWIGRYFYLQAQIRRRLTVALQEIEQVYRIWQEKSPIDTERNQAGLDLLYGFNTVLKRVALGYYPQIDVAKLTGNAWVRFLDTKDQGQEFSNGAGKVLSVGTYRPVFSADVDALRGVTQKWITQHYLNAGRKPPLVASTSTAGVSA